MRPFKDKPLDEYGFALAFAEVNRVSYGITIINGISGPIPNGLALMIWT